MKTNLSGLIEMPAAEYHALRAINNTGLGYVDKSPAHYRAYIKAPQEQTDAMILGTATHYGVFEPEMLYKNFFARPDGIDGRTKDGKAKLEELGRQNAGKAMLKADDMAMVEGMMKSVRNHKKASELISGGKAEMTAVCNDPEFGVLCKARPDYLRSDDIIVDLKTTDDASFFAFQRKVKSFRYHVQAAWYLDTVNRAIGANQFKRFILAVVEKADPFGVILYELDQDAISLGRAIGRRNLETYAKCLNSGEWPCYPDGVLTMTVPNWE